MHLVYHQQYNSHRVFEFDKRNTVLIDFFLPVLTLFFNYYPISLIT